MNSQTEHINKADGFLRKHGLKFRATLSDSKSPQWGDDGKHGHHYRVTLSKRGHGRSYDNQAKRLTFDFWASISDAEKLAKATTRKKELEGKLLREHESLDGIHIPEWSSNKLAQVRAWIADLELRLEKVNAEIEDSHPSAYDVLACISGDAYAPETFADFCAEYGYEQDSIKALQTFNRCNRFAKRLRAFFTETELEDLSQIS